MQMEAKTVHVNVERFSIITSRPFEDVVERLEAEVGHPDLNAFPDNVASAKTEADLERFIEKGLGPSGFMVLGRFNIGEVLRKERGEGSPRMLRLVIGNPLIMKKMVQHVPDAASYAPVTVLIDERPDGVHLSYDRMASLLASYRNAPALKIARNLDSKVEALLTRACGDHITEPSLSLNVS
jgi:uncharacterized protein (DUF302 family)